VPYTPSGQRVKNAMNFPARFEKLSKLFWTAAGVALLASVGILDFLTGYELAFSLFYLIPVSLVTWFASRRLGMLLALASAVVWLTADVTAGNFYSAPFIYAWNGLIRLGFFVITVLLLSTVKKTLERERESARTDYLTGAANARLFYDLVQMEIGRFQRYARPFTLANIDLDNFKAVNDRFGHPVGDQVLRAVVSSAREYLRRTDVLARLGGDEFALLLPETDQQSARVVVAKIQKGLLAGMRRNHWPVTFSIGVLTCSAAPQTTDELVRLTDELMYSVKRSGKDAIRYSAYAG
jgi:diguanylate cyclase (GGDEF)-like protein